MTAVQDRRVTRAYAEVQGRQVHYAQAGSGQALLLLHQTPRSWDEFRELIPILAPHRRVIAMDLPGMGASDPLPEMASIEAYAEAAVGLLDALGVDRADVLGHHTGSIVAIDLAARHPARVRRLVLSAAELIDEAFRAEAAETAGPQVDEAPVADDGSHVVKLWQGRKPLYPEGRTDLLVRFIRDALRSHDPREGHEACDRYEMERTIDAVVAPTLLLGHDSDPVSFPQLDSVAARIPHARTVVIRGGHIPFEAETEQVAAATLAFLNDDR